MRKYIPNTILRQILFLLIIAAFVWTVLKGFSSFLPGILGAICLFVLLIRPLNWMIDKWKMNKTLAVVLLILVSILIVLTPLIYLANILTSKVTFAIDKIPQIQSKIQDGLDNIHDQFGIDLLKEINLGDLSSVVVKIVHEILNTSIDSIVQIGVAYLLVYFMLVDYQKITRWMFTHSPLKLQNLTELNKDFRDLVFSNAIGIPLVALLQAIVAWIGYMIFGLDDSFNWFVLTAFGAMLPIVGAAAVYVPATLYMIAVGNTPNAYFLLIYCFVLVGLSDNVFRFWLQKIMVNIHPLITIFGVILGVKLFGFIGIIFGPIFLSLVFWLFRLYKLEFMDDEEKSISSLKEER